MYDKNVFINCPYDDDYRQIFDALVFTVTDCGFEARCAKEVSDSGEGRIGKIKKIIQQSGLGIHDISRTELDKGNSLPRFNMPLELGLFLGAKEFGAGKQKQKVCLILDRELYRYRMFISDISGQDISVHGGRYETAIKVVRDWLSDMLEDVMVPSGTAVLCRYTEFREALPLLCATFNMRESELTFIDFRNLVKIWLKEHSW